MKRIAIALCIALTACRDGTQPFEGPDPFEELPANQAGRLTWSLGPDRSPSWDADSDSVYYSGRGYPGLPLIENLLLQAPRTGGRVGLLLNALQGNVTPRPRLAAPVLSPNRQSLAFVELTDMYEPGEECNAGVICTIPPMSNIDTIGLAPLIAGVLRVRPVNGGAEQRIPIQFSERSNNRLAYPFQKQYEHFLAEIFRPAWSPDGTRIVYSDGQQLRLWNVGAATSTPIPNTEDGIWPAWSPNGSEIAFTRLNRGASHTVECGCMRQGRQLPIYVINKTIYEGGEQRNGTAVVIRPDGTNARTLGVGDAPAWTSDGSALIVGRNTRLERISAANGATLAVIPNTDFGFEPAISPNGAWLAFSRAANLDSRIDYDIWVVAF